MKISLEWLKQYVDYTDSPERLEEILTNIGFPVEDREQVGNDWMLDVEITSNRPDCLGHIGLAREVAAATGAAFQMPEVSFTEHAKNASQWTSVRNDTPQYCGRYTARIIDRVKIAPSPDWIRRRLETIGLRSISNVVDITNYVMMEIGQPLHAFDYDLLSEGRIVVRTALPGERMETIDHSQFELDPDMLVIADADKAVALAGIMGGLSSEVGDDAKTILLESAHFAPLSIRRTSRRLTLGTESSFRFERNVDMEMIEWASRRAAALLAELAGGSVAGGMADVFPARQERPEIQMRLSRLKKLIGIEFTSQYVTGLFERLGLSPQCDRDDLIICKAPSWRGDLSREADLIEEVIRMHGYDNIPTEPKIHITVKTPDAYQRTRGRVAAALNGCGFFETINVSFMDEDYWKLFAGDDFEPLRVKDLSRKSNNALRSSLLPSLVATRKRNQDAGNERCDFYELAAVHQPADSGPLPRETTCLAMITDEDFRSLRGVIEAVAAELDRQAKVVFRPADILWAEHGTGAEILINDCIIGTAGVASGKIINSFDLNNPLCMAEIDFKQLIQLEGGPGQLQSLPRFPGITRDLSLILAERITWSGLEDEISRLDIKELRTLEFVDIYRGKGVEKGKKSLTLSMEFRRADGTLRHEEVDKLQDRIMAALQEKFQVQLRS